MSLFISEDLIDTCVVETNRYAKHYIAKQAAIPPHSRVKKWVDTTTEEMRAFITLVMLSGINKRSSFDLYWSTDPLIDMKGFREVMPRDRFMLILRLLHLVNNNEQLPDDNPNYDKAFKIRGIIDALIPKWQRYFGPDKELSVDESIIPFKGPTSLIYAFQTITMGNEGVESCGRLNGVYLQLESLPR